MRGGSRGGGRRGGHHGRHHGLHHGHHGGLTCNQICSNEMSLPQPSWHWNKWVPSHSTTFTILSSRRPGLDPFAACCRPDYVPWVTDIARPAHFAEQISESEWGEKINKFNEALKNWWEPGAFWRDCLMSAQLYTFCLSGCIADSFDEEGGNCRVSTTNLRKSEAMEVLSPICAQLSDSNLLWSVDWSDPFASLKLTEEQKQEYRELQEINISRGTKVVKQLELTVKLRYPIEPFFPPAEPENTLQQQLGSLMIGMAMGMGMPMGGMMPMPMVVPLGMGGVPVQQAQFMQQVQMGGMASQPQTTNFVAMQQHQQFHN